ncbi:MAG: hypothetical protein IJ062_03510 [Firmicutes bacterium]|nr:hypothetical protein [Bacillota bacterium]
MLIGKLTDDDRFKVDYYREHRKERMSMCDWLDKVENRSIAEGEKRRAIATANSMFDDGFTVEQVVKYTKLSVAEATEILTNRKAVQPV